MSVQAAYFDALAPRWDGFHDLTAVGAALGARLAELGVAGPSIALDLGCGTGNLTQALLARLGPTGAVIAVDVSPGMLELAKEKCSDPRARFVLGEASALPVADSSADFALCFSAWPHFREPERVAAELLRALRPGGRLAVWHGLGRAQVNAIHAAGGEAVQHDVLVPAEELAALLGQAGFRVARAEESEAHYLVVADKPLA